jgi:hypothetical protein
MAGGQVKQVKPVRHEYGTPRYELAPGVESPNSSLPITAPPFPTEPGYYLLLAGMWVPTDGLTYRLSHRTIRVK